MSSPLHKLTPATKLIIFIALMQIAGEINSVQNFLIAGALFIIGLVVSKISLKEIMSKIKPFIVILLFTLLINIFFGSSTHDALFLSARFLFIILLSVLLTITTEPKTLVSVILLPIKGKIGQNLKIVMLVALEFIPLFIKEVKATANDIRNMSEYKRKPYKALTEPKLYITPIISNLISYSETVAEDVENGVYASEAIPFPKFHEILLTSVVLILMVKYAVQ